MTDARHPRVFVVIPCYQVADHVLDVIARIGPNVERIICVDDACPQASGSMIEQRCRDERVTVVYNAKNLGVGGATLVGYRRALAAGATIIVKVDGDGQMDPKLIPGFVRPIQMGHCDYTKGNRFYDPEKVVEMPKARLLGNAALSFLTKLSSGYWDVFDPTNGFTAIHESALRLLPLDKINQRWFFESDMLFRLNICRAVVCDIPMKAVYGSERSNLSASRVLIPFLVGNLKNLAKRLSYSYFVRDFSIASVELVVGTLAISFGLLFGCYQWWNNAAAGTTATAGSVMLAALPLILGFQMLLNALAYDMNTVPRYALQRTLVDEPKAEGQHATQCQPRTGAMPE